MPASSTTRRSCNSPQVPAVVVERSAVERRAVSFGSVPAGGGHALNAFLSDRPPFFWVLEPQAGGVKRLVLGSVAEALARYSSCATLVVR